MTYTHLNCQCGILEIIMRFFIALEISQESKNQLEIVQKKLQQIIPQLRLTDSEKLHLTIAFVGEQSEKIKDQLIEVMKNAVFGKKPFTVTPAYLDGFPDLHHAQTLWVGVKGDTDKLFVIQERVKDGLIGLGLEVDDRRYIPHIAIAKIKNFHLQPFQEAQLEKIMSHTFYLIRITSIKLFESVPQEGFHTHNTLAEIPLT